MSRNKFSVRKFLLILGLSVGLAGMFVQPVHAATTPTFFASLPGNDYTRMIVGPDSNLWLADRGNSRVARVNISTGAVNEFSISNASSLNQLAVGPDGNIWLADGAQVDKIIPSSGVVTQYAAPNSPYGIVTAPDGNMWLIGGSSIAVMDVSGNILNNYHLLAGGIYFGAVGADGNVWFNDLALPGVRKITPSGVVTNYRFPSGYNGPTSLTSDKNGNIWAAADNSAGRAQLIKISTIDGSMTTYDSFPAGSNNAQEIITDGAGNIWVSGNNNQIQEFAPDGSLMVAYDNPNSNGFTLGEALHPSGLFYYVDYSNNQLFSISASGGPGPNYGLSGNATGGGNSCTGNAAQNVACATVAVGAGSLIRLNAPDVNYATINLNGTAQITNANVAYQVRDATGSGAGWNMTLSATTFTDLSNTSHTLPDNALTLNAPTAQVCLTPGCTPANSSITGPVGVTTGDSSSYKIVNAAANTGMGSIETDTSSSLAIPASAYQGSYTSTWTLSLTSGP